MNLLRQIRTIQKRKIVVLVVVFLIMITLIFSYKVLIHGRYVSTNVIYATQIEIEDNQLEFVGSIISSGEGFSGYKYKIIDDNLYLQLRYSVVSKVNSTGSFKINMIDNDLKNVKNIYLQGEELKDVELLWSR